MEQPAGCVSVEEAFFRQQLQLSLQQLSLYVPSTPERISISYLKSRLLSIPSANTRGLDYRNLQGATAFLCEPGKQRQLLLTLPFDTQQRRGQVYLLHYHLATLTCLVSDLPDPLAPDILGEPDFKYREGQATKTTFTIQAYSRHSALDNEGSRTNALNLNINCPETNTPRFTVFAFIDDDRVVQAISPHIVCFESKEHACQFLTDTRGLATNQNASNNKKKVACYA